MKLNIGENIRKHRRNLGMTQEQLADRLGVSYQSVSRWENGCTYPDMELLPVIASLFCISVDELFGIPEEKKEKLAKETFTKLAKLSFEETTDTEMIIELIRDIRQNYLGSSQFVHFWLSVKNSVYRKPEILPEVRLLVETLLDGDFDMWKKNEAIAYMAKIEDDNHIENFLERYASKQDLTKNTLLSERFHVMGKWNENEPLRQLFLYEHIDQLLDNESLWRNFSKPRDAENCLLLNNLQLSLLHSFCNQKPDDMHPISGGKELDFLVHNRLWLGIRRAECLLATGNMDEGFIVLEDTTLLLEKVMKITEQTELRCTSPWLNKMVYKAEEAWNNSSGSALLADEEERYIWIYNEENYCYCIWPSWFLNVLTGKNGYNWFEINCIDDRYQNYIERIQNLVCTRHTG